MTAEELNQIKNERDEMKKHMTDMFDLAFMINNHDDLAKSQEHHEKLSRMVTHYMGNIQQSYGYMSEKAIKALEREPCADAVSRETVLKSLCELGYGDEENGAEAEYMYALQCVADKVKALPSVTPERPKGEWISTNPPGKSDNIVCTVCGYDSIADFNFCPNCGADMREVSECSEENKN